jgi:hypothetical protein
MSQLSQKMNGGDEIAVVYHTGKWYVGLVHEGNSQMAIVYGQCYDNRDEALSFAYSYHYRKYAVCVYDQDYDSNEKT